MSAPPSFSEKFAYKFDLWYTSDPMAEVILLSVINAAFTILLFIAFWFTGSLTDLSGFTWFSEMFWMSWGQLSGKAPKARDPDGLLWPTRTVRVFAAFAGMFAFSLIVGFIKSALKSRLKDLKLGKGRVFEDGFSMVIGWNDKVLPLVDQLTMANESSGGGVIVVMAPHKKPWMDGIFVDNIEDWRGSKIVTRKGDPINPNNLMKASAPRARSIVVLSQGADADEADAQAARCTLALTGGMGEWMQGHIVVELRDVDNAPVVKMGVPASMSNLERDRMVCPLVGADMVGRLMVQCSIEAGLATVFSHILEFAGNEFYFSDGKEWMGQLYGQTFAKIAFQFADAVCIGLKYSTPRDVTAENPKGEFIVINPLGTTILEEGDSLLFIAEDDDTYQPGQDMSNSPGLGPDVDEPPEPPTKTLLIGWRRDIQDMVLELDKWVTPGSQLTMLNHSVTEEDAKPELEEGGCNLDAGDCANVTVTFETQNPIFRRELERCNIPDYDAILVLTEELGPDGLSSDSRSMISMLLCRDLQKEAVRTRQAVTWGHKKPSTDACIIAEILDPRTADLMKIAATDDHIVSNAMISMALGQISEQADLHNLIEQLFSEDGNELHIKDIGLYAFPGEQLCFWEIMNRARQRVEVAIGYQLQSAKNGGAPEKGLIVNPLDKSEKILWQPGDKIVVLAED